ncbi:hypothetical protein D028_3547 [Vibrio parahaemolyticus 50]|nr:hypothetical protein [Vibrio parahaemolyticus]ETT14655.1 hypothetical protein D028_3547 [Vibrio parahaemolyticus 50]EVT83347.1 hypothetical protein D018_3731 [Vibrio parahaemolyticus VP2007-007]
MNDFKDLASFAGFSALTGLSFGTIFSVSLLCTPPSKRSNTSTLAR